MKNVHAQGKRIRSMQDFARLVSTTDSLSIVPCDMEFEERVHVCAVQATSGSLGVGTAPFAQRQSAHQKALDRANAALRDLNIVEIK